LKSALFEKPAYSAGKDSLIFFDFAIGPVPFLLKVFWHPCDVERCWMDLWRAGDEVGCYGEIAGCACAAFIGRQSQRAILPRTTDGGVISRESSTRPFKRGIGAWRHRDVFRATHRSGMYGLSCWGSARSLRQRANECLELDSLRGLHFRCVQVSAIFC